MNLTPPNFSRTCEAVAPCEDHTLHALGEHDLVDSTCGWEGEEREKDQMRNEEASAAGRLKPYFNMGSDLRSDVALPVTFVSERSRRSMPTGRCH